MAERKVFVTVGTTKFDALVKAMDSKEVAHELAVKGYTHLVMQIGDGSYLPEQIVPKGALRNSLANGLQVEMFKYAPDLQSHMASASLIISHAGSGSLFEALRLGKPTIAVPNAILMANHQAELADHLEKLGHCKSATPQTVLEILQDFDEQTYRPYKPGSAADIVCMIDKHMALA